MNRKIYSSPEYFLVNSWPVYGAVKHETHEYETSATWGEHPLDWCIVNFQFVVGDGEVGWTEDKLVPIAWAELYWILTSLFGSERTARDEGGQPTMLPKCPYLCRYLIFAGNVLVKKSNWGQYSLACGFSGIGARWSLLSSRISKIW
jgi:hypothetical protein